MSSLKKSQWDVVREYFLTISKISRCSGKESKISNFLMEFAHEYGLLARQDQYMNVYINKNGSIGYENAKTLILQAHMDMVCVKDKDANFDFENDPIRLQTKDGFLSAVGTSLGADNGIALAYCLTLLGSVDIPHPPLEVLITAGEEIGMIGASNLDAGNIQGKMLINMDSEEEGRLLLSCAGGVNNTLILPIQRVKKCIDAEAYRIEVSGLKGGHSGLHIDKERGNAIKLISRFLADISTQKGFMLVDINGGNVVNAIPNKAEAIIYINPQKEALLRGKIDEWNKIMISELSHSDPDVILLYDKVEVNSKTVFTDEAMNKLLYTITALPNGIQTMSTDIKGLAQSSVNIGTIISDDFEIKIASCVRSSVKSLKVSIAKQIDAIAILAGAYTKNEGDYPEWQYKSKSDLLDICKKAFYDLYGTEPEIYALHAGVECGWLIEKIGDIEMVSIGPNLYDVHTTRERLDLESARRTWEYLLKILESIK